MSEIAPIVAVKPRPRLSTRLRGTMLLIGAFLIWMILLLGIPMAGFVISRAMER